jgi:hypothetical protein
MAAFDTSTNSYEELLKNVYEPLIQKQINDSVPLYERIKESTSEVQVSGRGLTWAVDLGRVASFHALGEGDTLPTALVGTEEQATATPKEAWGRVQFTKRVMAMSKSNQGAFANVVNRSMEKLTERAKENIGRQIIGNKVSGNTNTGILGAVNVADGAVTTLPIDTGSMYHFFVGQTLAIGTGAELAAGTPDATATVTAVDHSGNSVTIASTAVDNNDLIVEGTTSSNAYGSEITGLDFIVSDEDDGLYGVTGHSGTWSAYIDGNSGVDRNWSSSLMNKVGYGVKVRSGKHPEVIACHTLSMLEIPEELRQDVRYQAQELKGGFKRGALKWMIGDKEAEIVTDDFVKLGQFLFLSPSDLRRGMTEPLGFLDDDGRNMLRVANTVSFEMIFGCIMELVAFRRDTHGKLEDIAVDTTNLPGRN